MLPFVLLDAQPQRGVIGYVHGGYDSYYSSTSKTYVRQNRLNPNQAHPSNCLTRIMPRFTPLAQESWRKSDAVLECPFRPSLLAHDFALRNVFSRAPVALCERVLRQHNPTLLIEHCINNMEVIAVIVATSELTPERNSFLHYVPR